MLQEMGIRLWNSAPAAAVQLYLRDKVALTTAERDALRRAQAAGAT